MADYQNLSKYPQGIFRTIEGMSPGFIQEENPFEEFGGKIRNAR